MPENTVNVARPSLWGNPWSLKDVRQAHYRLKGEDVALWAVAAYRRELTHFGMLSDYSERVSEATWEAVADRIRDEIGATCMADAVPHFLRGKNLACWCPLDQPCHADVLLELANGDPA